MLFENIFYALLWVVLFLSWLIKNKRLRIFVLLIVIAMILLNKFYISKLLG